MNAEPDTQAASDTGMLPCTQAKDTAAQSDIRAISDVDQHHAISHESKQGVMGEITASLQCDGALCQGSCSASIPPASSTTILIGGDSYAVLFNTHFTSLVPEQLQRPPLA